MNSIKDIEKKCISCGACKVNCPNNAINFTYDKKEERYIPYVDIRKCSKCGLCYKMCPKVNHYFDNSLLGKSMANYLAHSTNNKVQEDATSGGVVNSVVRFLVESKYVDAAFIVSKADNEIESDVKIITVNNISDLTDRPRDYTSRYVTVPLLKEITTKYERIAIVGTPCQIYASTLMSHEFRKRIVFRIGIACSSGLGYGATKQYKRLMGLENGKIYYRGRGWPGKNTIYTEDNMIENEHLGSLFERIYSSQIYKLRGCRTCNDQFAYMSDISVCDYWNDEEKKYEKKGNSCVIIRNEKALDIWNQIENKGYINYKKILLNAEVIETQRYVLISKMNHNSLGINIFYKVIDLVKLLRVHKLFNYFAFDLFARVYGKITFEISRKYQTR